MRRIRVLVADGGKARFIDRMPPGGAYRTVRALDSAHLHEKEHDLGRDRPARVHERIGAVRHAVEPKSELKERAKRDFLALVEAELAAMAERGEFDEAVVVAPARWLTVLREARAAPIAARVIAEIDADLTNTPDAAMAEHLDEPVPALARYGAALRAIVG